LSVREVVTATGAAPLSLPLEPGITRPLALELAATEYDRYTDQLRALSPDDWSRPTECKPWDVRAMVAHSLGMAEMSASVVETARQMRAASKRQGDGEQIDALTAVQVDKHVHREPADLVRRFAEVGPRATRGRQRTPAFARKRNMPGDQLIGDRRERWRLGFLVDVCYTRDVWMHRVDIARATGRELVLTPEHDGVLIADIVREWAARHGQACALTLTGPAGGSWTWGAGGPSYTLDAVEFCRILSGRSQGEGLLQTQVPF
jgi:uncharacterized protein (TIGR03083 family)